jgi:4-amino-4-deoxy-L-arabinose transferase-like glycosyltransferase
MCQKDNLWFIIFFAACVFIMLGNLHGWNLDGPDEPRYAQISREMMETGQYILPHKNAETYPDKPPLFFWLIACASKPGGDVTAFSARLPSVIAALGMILLVYMFARKLYDPAAALLASFILFTSRKFFNVCLSAHFDPLLAFWILLALFLFYLGYEKKNSAGKYYLLSYVSMGCALLTKGPVGFVLPLLTIVVFLILKKDVSEIKNLGIGKGLLIILGMLALWLVPACLLGGSEYTHNIIFKQTFGRAVNSFAHKAPFYYYLLTFPSDFLPWTIFIPAAGMYFWTNRLKKTGILFPLVWFGTTFILFSLVSGKRALYLLPLYPAAALIMGKFFGDLLRMEAFGITALQKRLITIPGYMLFATLSAAGFFFIVMPAHMLQDFAPAKKALLPVAWCAAMGGIAGFLYIKKKHDIRCILRALAVLFMAMSLVTVVKIFPVVKNMDSGEPFFAKIQELVGPHDTLIASFKPERFNFFLHRYPIAVMRDSASLEQILQTSERVYYLTRERDYTDTPEDVRGMLKMLEKGKIGRHNYYLFVNKTGANTNA